MSARLSTCAAAIAAACAFAGCGGGPAATAIALTDEDRAFAESEEEVWGFLPKPKPKPKPRPTLTVSRPDPVIRRSEPRPRPRPRRRPRRRSSFNPDKLSSGLFVRGGALVTVAAEEGTWPAAANLAIGYRIAKGSTSTTIFDLGIDYSAVETVDKDVNSVLVAARGEVLFGNWSAYRKQPIMYVVGGAYALMSETAYEGSGTTTSSAAAGLGAGFGFGSGSGKWDLRAVYSFIAGSENVTGNVLVSFGFSM
jgi:hypothetical protein